MGYVIDALGLVGTTVDQVRFDACVDAGGFGLIYKGRHLGLDEVVAIKALRLSSASIATEDVQKLLEGRFRDETKLLYRLSQGNLDIVRCIGSGTITSPITHEITPYMVLEWLEGKTLTKDLHDRKEAGLPNRTLEEVIAVLDPAAQAIAYAHAQGVVHRDVKPGNLFLARSREGNVRMKVLDFGLAKILTDETGVIPTAQTVMGLHFCSPAYGAPEQFTANLGPVSPATDVYALVLVILEMLTGEKVRPAATLAEGLAKALDPTTGSPRASNLGLHLAPAVEELLHRAVSIDPGQRPVDVGILWSALKEVAATAPRTAPPPHLLTVADANVADAMDRVRNAQQAPLGGTLLMAPPRPPVSHAGKTRSVHPPAPSPLAASVLSSPPPAPTTGTVPTAPPLAPRPPPPAHFAAPAPMPMRSMTPPRMPTPMNPVRAHTDPTIAKPRRPKQSSGAVPAVIVFFAILIFGGAGVFWYWRRTQQTP